MRSSISPPYSTHGPDPKGHLPNVRWGPAPVLLYQKPKIVHLGYAPPRRYCQNKEESGWTYFWCVSEGTCQPEYIRAGLGFLMCSRRGCQPGNNYVGRPFYPQNETLNMGKALQGLLLLSLGAGLELRASHIPTYYAYHYLLHYYPIGQQRR